VHYGATALAVPQKVSVQKLGYWVHEEGLIEWMSLSHSMVQFWFVIQAQAFGF